MDIINIYAACLRLGMTPAGAAGCAANIWPESAGRANNVEDRSGIEDAAYTQSVDNGTYKWFVTDRFGYGLVQWTSPARKEALLNEARSSGVSIGNQDMQFQFMKKEMQKDYPYVWQRLTTSDDPYECGYVMCKFYEIPADTERQAQYRGTLAEKFYEQCSGEAPALEPQPQTDYWPPRMVDKGMSGADVTVLQAILVARGYTVTAVNGIFDESTDKAVRKFQTDNGLDADGVCGPKTWAVVLRG